MQDFEQILLSQVKDIKNIHEVSAWPPAAGWWLIIFLFCAAFFVILKKYLKVIKYKKSWKYKLELELDKIAKDSKKENIKLNLSKINNILKRVSMQIYGRKESASLTGKKWLIWLSNRDPENFNWLKKADILIEYPYMPEDKINLKLDQVAIIAKAVKPWLKL
jgi:hypothetical protein